MERPIHIPGTAHHRDLGKSDWEDQDLLTLDEAGDRLKDEISAAREQLSALQAGEATDTELQAARRRVAALESSRARIEAGPSPLARTEAHMGDAANAEPIVPDTLKVGDRLASQVDTTEVIVTRVADPNALVACGGLRFALAPHSAITEPPGLDGPGLLLGKRYTDAYGSLELLCVKAGQSRVTVNGRAVEVKQAKSLPSSD